MNNLFKKTILISLLTVFLWGGLSFKNNSLNQTIGVGTIYARSQAEINADCSARFPGSTDPAGYANCVSSEKSDEFLESSNWFVFRETLKNMGSILADGAIKTTVAVIGGLMQLIVIPVLGSILSIVASCLDIAIQFTLNSGNITNVNSAIVLVWSIVRNIFNITFIFILLYTAIKTIIGSASANTKKMIANVIIAALLINFSLFFTRIIIDAGNILATSLYNLAIGTGTMSAKIVDDFGLVTLFKATNTNSIFSTEFFIITALQSFTILLAIITFIYVALLMFVRNVMLIFLMALSPIGFMGDVLPKISEYSKMWRENLYGQVFVAPIFLLLFYLIISLGAGLVPSKSITGEAANYVTYFKYVMTIILLITAVKITKKMSGVVGGAVEKVGMLAVGAAIGAATGGAALLARQTLGRGAAAALAGNRGADLRARAASGNIAARMQLATLEKGAKSTFDIRNTKVTGNILGQVSKATGIGFDIGKTSGVYGKGTGFTGLRAEQQEKENKIYNEFKTVSNKQRLAANSAIQARDNQVKANLQANAQHTSLKAEKDKYLDITNHKDLVNENQGYDAAKQEKDRLDAETSSINKSGNSAQREQHRRDLVQAEKDLNNAKRIRDEKAKAIQKELKEKYAGEIAELDEQMKALKIEEEKKVEKTMSPDDQAKIAVVEKARNYADSVRQGRTGKWTFASRGKDLAQGMENQSKS